MDNLSHPAGGAGRHRDDGLLNVQPGDFAPNLLGRTQNPYAVDTGGPFVAVIIEKCHRVQPIPGLQKQLMRQRRARVTGANDGDSASRAVARFLGGSLRLTHSAQGEVRAAKADQREDQINEDHAARRSVWGAQRKPHAHRHRGANDQGVEHPRQVRRAEVPQERRQLKKQREQDQLDRHQPEQHLQPFPRGGRADPEIKPQLVG